MNGGSILSYPLRYYELLLVYSCILESSTVARGSAGFYHGDMVTGGEGGPGEFFFWTHFRLRKFSTQSGQRSNSTRSHTPVPVGSSLAAAEIWHL